jgi:hypothetical protein
MGKKAILCLSMDNFTDMFVGNKHPAAPQGVMPPSNLYLIAATVPACVVSIIPIRGDAVSHLLCCPVHDLSWWYLGAAQILRP